MRYLTFLGVPLVIVLAIYLPRAVEICLGAMCLAGAASGMRAVLIRPPEQHAGGIFHPVAMIGLVGLFGGGSIAWGFLMSARIVAGCACLLILMHAFSARREKSGEAFGCALILGLFAVTGWLGLFPPYLEETIWPGTPASRTIHGIVGYLAFWLAGLALVSIAFGLAIRRKVEHAPVREWSRVAATCAALGFGMWLVGALFTCGALAFDSTDSPGTDTWQ